MMRSFKHAPTSCDGVAQAPSKPSKVFHIIDMAGIGGAQEIIRSLAESKAYPRQEIIFLHASDEELAQWNKLLPSMRLVANKWLILFGMPKLIHLLYIEKNSLFNAHLEVSTFLLMFLRKLIGFRLVLTLHALPSQISKMYYFIFCNMCYVANAFIVEDRINQNVLKTIKISKNKIHHIPLGTRHADCPIKPDRNIRDEFSISNTAILLLVVGRMVFSKGHLDAIYSLKILRQQNLDCHLILIGDGVERVSIQKEINNSQLQLWVHCAGIRRDLYNFYAKSDLLLMPCKDESMGVTVAEALVYGLPVIAYNNGSIREVIDGEHKGILVASNPEALAEGIKNKIPSTRADLNQDEIKRFSANEMARQYFIVYNSMP